MALCPRPKAQTALVILRAVKLLACEVYEAFFEMKNK